MAKHASHPNDKQKDAKRQVSVSNSTDAQGNPSSTDPSFHSSPNEGDTFMIICNAFWRPYLSFNPFKYGDTHLVEFSSIWGDENSLREGVTVVFQEWMMQNALIEMCKLVLRSGPLRMLKVLIENKYVEIDQTFEDGLSMLHLACIARNFEAVLYLVHSGINLKIQDKHGRTAEQVCFSSKIRRLLPKGLGSLQKEMRLKPKLQPSMKEKATLFELCKSIRNFEELQIKLQTLEFDVNEEQDQNGDFLIHVVAGEGLPLLPLLLSLVRIQGADVEKCNSQGKTPLMIAAESGNSVLVDVMLCILGANPNTPNSLNGWRALHYAAKENHVDTTNCLIKRGADFNLENNDGKRPDDGADDGIDCKEVIQCQRIQRIEYLTDLVKEGELFPCNVRWTDMFAVDQFGSTLLMTAAEFNRLENLEVLLERENLDVLLEREKSSINAQHAKSGSTALGIAAKAGHSEVVRALLSHGANPAIRDIEGALPLHHAVTHNHIHVVNTLLQYQAAFTNLALAIKIAKRPVIQERLKDAWQKRQQEIVTPALFQCALTGNAELLYNTLEEGDDVNPSSAVGNTPLFLAVENAGENSSDHLEIIKMLQEFGGDIGRPHQGTGNTLFHAACSRGNVPIVQYLAQFTKSSGPRNRKVFDINALNYEGQTALEIAAKKGFRKIVKLVLGLGATTALVDGKGDLLKFSEYEGVQVLIESQRQAHTRQVMQCMYQRKGLKPLKTVWQPKFDHNLRDSNGDTPLMVAARNGKEDIVKFLLESAVYDLSQDDLERRSTSSTDSGTVQDASSKPKMDVSSPDESEVETSTKVAATPDMTPGWSSDIEGRRPSSRASSIASPGWLTDTDATIKTRKVHKRFHLPSFPTMSSSIRKLSWRQPDAESQVRKRLFAQEASSDYEFIKEPDPRKDDDGASLAGGMVGNFVAGLQNAEGTIFREDGKVSHVLAINPRDGCTALHRAIEGGDNYSIALLLVEADLNCLNMQDHAGLAPLHLACKLVRKKTVEKLTQLKGIDLNIRTLEGKLPHEMAANKSLAKMVHNARDAHPMIKEEEEHSPTHSVSELSAHSWGKSSKTTFDFDKLNMKFKQIKGEKKLSTA
ncbi:ankyrin-1 isoform X1 [Lingula anatina]|uniref:Ankyrin-1 isoform X1 n=2 Tax=Lingula anatina TaxID=7574 RepID=A0A2R2MLV2_LINAN|nr:ankyrin-1 isoform X1 [Lingula anatina]|eukprot:XP_023931037.1 ankyrin-1 isoform X1 [Lingula anatina]